MPHMIIEYIPNHVAYMLMWGHVHTDEVHAANEDGMARVENSPHIRHFIADFRFVTDYPKNIWSVIETMKLFSHPKHGWQFIIVDNPVMKFISSVILQTAKKSRDHIFLTDDPEEVRLRLMKLYPEMSDLPPMPDAQAYIESVKNAKAS